MDIAFEEVVRAAKRERVRTRSSNTSFQSVNQDPKSSIT